MFNVLIGAPFKPTAPKGILRLALRRIMQSMQAGGKADSPTVSGKPSIIWFSGIFVKGAIQRRRQHNVCAVPGFTYMPLQVGHGRLKKDRCFRAPSIVPKHVFRLRSLSRAASFTRKYPFALRNQRRARLLSIGNSLATFRKDNKAGLVII